MKNWSEWEWSDLKWQNWMWWPVAGVVVAVLIACAMKEQESTRRDEQARAAALYYQQQLQEQERNKPYGLPPLGGYEWEQQQHNERVENQLRQIRNEHRREEMRHDRR